ncbi:MAG: UbiA family prenyltransferase, partial [Treponema sp.]|nr:UbiA family prenyltransferase [Treponema sp.]
MVSDLTVKPAAGRMIKKIRLIGEAIIFRHTLFSLPIAFAALLLESSGRLPLRETVLILVAAVAGRSTANAMNRVIDADIDKKNPRTAGRHLPSGTLSK